MYGSSRPKRTMPGFNVEEFAVINKQCVGVSKSHKHEAWGIHKGSNKFATSLETAYPMGLARIIAAQFVLALQRRGIRMPPDALAGINELDNLSLSAMRAQTGLQPKASKLPPVISVYSCKVALTGFQTDLPQFWHPPEGAITDQCQHSERPNSLAKRGQTVATCTTTAALLLPTGRGDCFGAADHWKRREQIYSSLQQRVKSEDRFMWDVRLKFGASRGQKTTSSSR